MGLWDSLTTSSFQEASTVRKNNGKAIAADKAQALILLDTVNDHFLVQVIKDPTRVINILDLQFVNSDNFIHDYEILSNVFTSDHDTIIINTNIGINDNAAGDNVKYNIYSTNICDFEMLEAHDDDIEAVCDELNGYDWDNIMDDDNPTENADLFINALEKAVNNNLKIKTEKINCSTHGNNFNSKNFIPRKVRAVFKMKASITKKLKKSKCVNRVLSIRKKIIQAELLLETHYNDWKKSKEEKIFHDSTLNKEILYWYPKNRQKSCTKIGPLKIQVIMQKH